MYDVAIIGCGPTGATLANLLADRGLSVLVIDREPEMYHLPRAVHFDDEVMRVFQTAGIADALADQVCVNPGMRFVDDADNLLLDWPRPQEITMHGWHASYRLHQPDLERLLRGRLATRPTAQFRPGCAMLDLQVAPDHISLMVADRASGARQSLEARYVIGCDGANSQVRQTLQSDMEDLGFEERWLVVDLLLKKPRPDLGDHTMQFCNPDRPMTYCRSPGQRRRWEITIKQGETAQEMTKPDRVWALLSRWITPEDADLERQAVYTFRSQVARKWRAGRLLIAGDAAHLTPPFLGQGMCAGIRDAANLAWKLADVLTGRADASLLDSYQAERAPHARTYIETAMRLGGLINSLDRDAALKLARDRQAGRAEMRSIAPKLGPSDQAPVRCNLPEDPVGRPFANPALGPDDRSLDDLVGYHHLIVSRDAAPFPDREDIRCLSARNFPALAAELDRLKAEAVWVRPDRYIGAVAASAETLRRGALAFLKD